ncbi:hypothetical protein B0T25DRAFT_261097 [Lasiosphaeria hispida]|uniref:UDP-N-acetylglucosamine transferase subunit ALG13 n=1 Tax=Lasiosphaeria hispida TaxID=260671 RepID=A0AAJ0HG34_9PEZI|nr:hypothetical protein B0T25DRAFT_261097 [Lasiosphaeria hispida]
MSALDISKDLPSSSSSQEKAILAMAKPKLNEEEASILPRRCLVTIGATAGFRSLLAEVITPKFLASIASKGFENLDVQCGPDLAWFRRQLEEVPEEQRYDVEIDCFAFTKNLTEYMVHCRFLPGVRDNGCVISHAGSGTVLEALKVQAPLVVVPNPTLMDNHQAELAEECEKQKWATYGKLGNLAKAVNQAMARVEIGTTSSAAFTPYAPPPFPVPEAERTTLFDWMVLTCYPEELRRQQYVQELGSAHVEAKPKDKTAEDLARLQVD